MATKAFPSSWETFNVSGTSASFAC